MKLSRKVTLLCLFIVLACSLVFVGCSKKSVSASKKASVISKAASASTTTTVKKEKVKLTVLGYGDNTKAEGKAFKRICEEFQDEHPEIDLQWEMLFDETYHQKVIARLAAGDIPDIAYMGADSRWGGPWQEAGQSIDNNAYYPSYIDVSLIPDYFGDGTHPCLPIGGPNYCTVVGVNMQLLEQIGGTLPTTYEEFKALAKLCKDNGIICMATHGGDAWVWGSCVLSGILPRITGRTQWIEDCVAGEVKFTDDDFIACLDVLSQWVKDGILTPNAAMISDEEGMANFKSGKYLMYIDGQWGFGEGNYGDLSDDIKLIPIPPVPGEKANAGSIAGAWQVGYGITKKASSNPEVLEAAKEWIAYFNSEEEIIQRLSDGIISSALIKDFEVPAGMDPLISEKATLISYPSCSVIDSTLTGTPNDFLNAGMQDIVMGKRTAADLAASVQKAFDSLSN